MKDLQSLATKLLRWFQANARDLPWRKTRDPYAIWISEVMLQQTRVDTVLDYYERFLRQFPTIEHLAKAPLEAVLKAWEGMGYYARARNLHRAAQEAWQRYRGFPPTYKSFRKLPGVGAYTAAAVWAISFGERHLPLDGNIRRVLARLFDLATLKDSEYRAVGEPILQEVPDTEISVFVQAVMELGALVCTPKSPRCPECPVRSSCLALARGTVLERPLKRAPKPRPHYEVVLAYLQNDRGEILLTRRKKEGFLGGLWELPGGKVEPGESLKQAVRRELYEELGLQISEDLEYLGHVRHGYTHFSVTLHVFLGRTNHDPQWIRGPETYRWVPASQVHTLPLPRGTHKALGLIKNASAKDLFHSQDKT